MAKWYGAVGYIINSEVTPGVWSSKAVERPYFGDVIKAISKWKPANKVNDDVDVSSQISIVADPFAYQNFQSIKYVEFMGAFWEVTSIEPQRPRLILSIGGVYNGRRPETEESPEVTD